jgi:hypothetical protein
MRIARFEPSATRRNRRGDAPPAIAVSAKGPGSPVTRVSHAVSSSVLSPVGEGAVGEGAVGEGAVGEGAVGMPKLL